MGFEKMAAGVAYHLCFLLLVTQVQGSNFDVKAYGAKANGMTDDSKVQDENFCLEFRPEHFLQIQFA